MATSTLLTVVRQGDELGIAVVTDGTAQVGTAESPLADADDAALIDAMLAHPVLINRPIVVTAQGTKLCRPSEAVLDILPQPQRGAFSKEDGEPVVDAAGNRIV